MHWTQSSAIVQQNEFLFSNLIPSYIFRLNLYCNECLNDRNILSWAALHSILPEHNYVIFIMHNVKYNYMMHSGKCKMHNTNV